MGGTAFVHDARGNLTSDGVRTYAYDPENRLTSVTAGAAVTTLTYDPLGRLKRIDRTGTAGAWLLWDGDRLLAEYDGGTGQLTHLYADGPGPNEPLAEFRQPARTWLLADHQGSIVGETDATGALIGSPFTYDPYGRPDAAHGFAGPRFRYTGQTMIVPQVPLWHYKARAYDPSIGRFLQTDPIGYEDSLNLYQYVGNDPFNGTDPTGMLLYSSGSDGCTVNCMGSGASDMLMMGAQDPVRELFASTPEYLYFATRGSNGELLSVQAFASGRAEEATIAPWEVLGALPRLGARAGSELAGSVGIWLAPRLSSGGPYTVYTYIEDGVVRYVVMTVDVRRRAGEQLRQRGIRIRPVLGLSQLTYR